jgi:hypothetical protein
MKKITWWNIVGQQTKTLSDKEAQELMQKLDNCDILYHVTVIQEEE